MDLVYELFSKLGLRYICVLKDGRYAGMVSVLVISSVFEILMGVFRHTRKRL